MMRGKTKIFPVTSAQIRKIKVEEVCLATEKERFGPRKYSNTKL